MFAKYMFVWCGLLAIFLSAGLKSKIAKGAVLILPAIIAVILGMALGIEPLIQPGWFFTLFAVPAVVMSNIGHRLQERKTQDIPQQHEASEDEVEG